MNEQFWRGLAIGIVSGQALFLLFLTVMKSTVKMLTADEPLNPEFSGEEE